MKLGTCCPLTSLPLGAACLSLQKQWEAAISTAASAGDTVRTGLESAYRDLRQALLEAKRTS